MDPPAILAAIDVALETKLPAGIRAGAESEVLHAVCRYLADEDDTYQHEHDYRGVTIRRSLAQLGPDGWLVKALDGHDRPIEQPRDERGRFISAEDAND